MYLMSALRLFSVPLESSQSESDAGAIAGGVAAVLVVLVAIGAVGVMYTR